MLVPNDERVIVKLLETKAKSVIMLSNDDVKIGENLQLCRILHPGNSKFKQDQIVVVMEYSMAGVYKDIGEVLEGKVPYSVMTNPENKHYIVATADVMAVYEDD